MAKFSTRVNSELKHGKRKIDHFLVEETPLGKERKEQEGEKDVL